MLTPVLKRAETGVKFREPAEESIAGKITEKSYSYFDFVCYIPAPSNGNSVAEVII
jgi:hypothetical protein